LRSYIRLVFGRGLLRERCALDAFGFPAALGEFDNSGYADVDVNSSHQDVGTLNDPGVVNVLFGSVAG
jgi:hypothetical protein